MKNEKLIIKKIIRNYMNKYSYRDFSESLQPYFNKLYRSKDKKRLLNELFEKVTYQKRRERFEGKAEYYDTIGKNYYGGDL